MKRMVEIFVSRQAHDLMEFMPDIKEEEVIDWFINNQKISIGGGNIVDYIKWKKEQEQGDR